MSLAFFEAPPLRETTDRDRLYPEILTFLERYRITREQLGDAAALDWLRGTFFGAVSALQAEVGLKAVCELLFAEQVACIRRLDVQRQVTGTP